jgi:hypothetical protein
MLTTVRRDMLDKSISGDKIFGGTINWIDGLYTDYLRVPHSGSTGTGSIDGENFVIGSNHRIASVQANNVHAAYWLGLRNEASGGGPGTDFSLFAQRAGVGVEFKIKDRAGAVRVELNTNTKKNYMLDKFIVGGSSELDPTVKLESPSALLGITKWDTAYGTTSYLGDAFANDDNDASQSLRDLFTWVYVLLDHFTEYEMIKEPWITLGTLTANEAGQLTHIDTSEITVDNWTYLQSLDQNIGTGDAPLFEGIHIGAQGPGDLFENFLEDYKEWIGKDAVASLDTLDVNIKVDIIKCGKMVTLDVYRSGASNNISFTNSTGFSITALNIWIPIDIEEILIDNNIVTWPGIFKSFNFINDNNITPCLISPPYANGEGVGIWLVDLSNIILASTKLLILPSFSISYIIK